MADGKITIGTYEEYPFTQHGKITIGYYGVSPPTIKSVLTIGEYYSGSIFHQQFNAGTEGKLVIAPI
jgi:hypothetical protein